MSLYLNSRLRGMIELVSAIRLTEASKAATFNVRFTWIRDIKSVATTFRFGST